MLSFLKRVGFKPYIAVWEITLACNLNCRHCGSRAGKARPDELDTAEALRLARDLTALGTRRITLSGGEPTLRTDWPLIAEALIAGGARVALLTNGRSWNKDLAMQAKLFGLDTVAFSIDGCEVTHDYIRRVPGQWQKLLDNIDITRAMGVKVSVVTQINRKNLQELEQIRQTLSEHGVAAWQLQIGIPTGNLADHPDLVIRPEDMLEIIPRIAALKRMPGIPRVYPSDNIGYYGEYEFEIRDRSKVVPFWVGCRAGCTVIGIESNGNIKGCLSLPSAVHGVDRFVEGNIRERPLREIWEDRQAFAYNRQFTVDKLQGFCRECEFAEICRGGCSWTSFAHVGETGGNPYCYYRQLKEKEKREAAASQG